MNNASKNAGDGQKHQQRQQSNNKSKSQNNSHSCIKNPETYKNFKMLVLQYFGPKKDALVIEALISYMILHPNIMTELQQIVSKIASGGA